jgi:hypothetical protein
VKVTEAATAEISADHAPVKIVEIARGVGIIVVGPSSYLSKIPLLRLVEVAPTRFLLSMPIGTPVDSVEVQIIDLLEKVPASEARERSMLGELRELLRVSRQQDILSNAQIVFVDTLRFYAFRNTNPVVPVSIPNSHRVEQTRPAETKVNVVNDPCFGVETARIIKP